jgi:hypothetical protein
LDDLHAIDPRLVVVWQPWRTEFDNVMNEHTGSIEDPRFNIHLEDIRFGREEIWGWVLKGFKNEPIPENRWHIWQRHDHGYSHVMAIAPNLDKDVLVSSLSGYLYFLARRMYLQGKFVDKYGAKKWYRMLHQKEEEKREQEKVDTNTMMDAIADENSWLIKSAADNFMSGRTAPVRPQKDIIYSGRGLNNRSKITRDATDAEGGIVLPGDVDWVN